MYLPKITTVIYTAIIPNLCRKKAKELPLCHEKKDALKTVSASKGQHSP